MQRRRGNWWALAEFGVFATLFVWLRWYSPFWQNRWIGFCLGVAFVLTNLNWQRSARQQVEFARKYDLPKRVTILGAVAFTTMGGSALKRFLVGPPYFSRAGVRAASDDGFFGVVACILALQYLYAPWLILVKNSDQSSENPAAPLNHG